MEELQIDELLNPKQLLYMFLRESYPENMRWGIVLVIAFIVFFSSISHAETLKIDRCSVIDTPGYYLVVSDLTNLTAETCIMITSNDVILDGNGHTIKGVSQKFRTGVLIHSLFQIENVTITNITVKNWYYGIYIRNAKDVEISFSKITNNSRYGTYISNSTLILIENNRFANNGVGFSFEKNSKSFTAYNNTIEDNLDGIYIIDSSHGLIDRNTIRNNWGGIWIFSSFQVVASNNTIYKNKDGIWISRSDYNVISNNRIYENENGVWIFDYSLYNTLKGNVVYKNGLGLRMFNYTAFNTIYNNIFNNTVNVELDNTTQNTWNVSTSNVKNIIQGSTLGGNYWAKPNNTGFSQTCKDSDRDGICDLPYYINSKNVDYRPLTDMQEIETVLDSINDTLEQLITKYNPSFDWKTQTPAKQDVMQAVINAVIQYFSTQDQNEKQPILNDVVQLVGLYFSLQT